MPDSAQSSEVAAIPAAPAPRETLQDYVYRKVRELILNGEIRPGQSITMQSLATAFAVSHMPVREALQRLTAERALAVVAGRSIGIPPLSRDRLEDLRRVRIEIEGLATAWATERIGADTLRRLGELQEVLDRAVRAGDVKLYLRANRELHFAIYAAAGSPTLTAVIESLWLQISPYFNLLHESGNFPTANRHHGELIRAIAARDAPAARAALRADIEAAAACLRELL
ncbi:MAG: GntR family transcriptional regulator [Paracoccaceae bacterium]|nr:MAG: GntR family transcriptional regulator [Paracoccaceae bacterium]